MRRTTPITWDQVRVGIFLLVALSLLAFGVFMVGETGHIFGRRYTLVTLLPSAAGLVPGATVQVAGQNAGQVDRIEFIDPARRPPGGEAVAVWLAVDFEVQQQIREDSRVRVRTQGLLGDRLIDIEPGSPDIRMLLEGDTLQAAPSVSFNELFDEAAVAVTELTDLTRNLSAITEQVLEGDGALTRLLQDDELYAHMVGLSGSLDELLGAAARGDGALGRLLWDEELYDRLAGTAASLDSITAQVAAGEGTLGRLLGDDSLYRALTGVAVRSDSILEALQTGEGAMGRLFTDETMYEELLKTLVDLNAALAELRADPRRYIPPVRVF